jgi:hypothetical protein
MKRREKGRVLDEFEGDLMGVYPEGYLEELRAEWD